MATCCSPHSRNRQTGELLARRGEIKRSESTVSVGLLHKRTKASAAKYPLLCGLNAIVHKRITALEFFNKLPDKV
jgi:glycerol-3-phosphate dehydrogenase